jgi:hypothetical protein
MATGARFLGRSALPQARMARLQGAHGVKSGMSDRLDCEIVSRLAGFGTPSGPVDLTVFAPLTLARAHG